MLSMRERRYDSRNSTFRQSQNLQGGGTGKLIATGSDASMKQTQPKARPSSKAPAAGKTARRYFPVAPLVVFALGTSLLLWLIADAFRKPAPVVSGPVPADGPAMAAPTNTGPTPAPAVNEPSPLPDVTRQKLLGRWQRTDAEYAIEIRLIGVDGVTDARYFNPFNRRSINVAKASVTARAGATEFFMELRDVGYPGSTYTLRYDDARDELTGVYFQAALQERYDVVFQRMRAP
jgi:hypothetical protein